jgi:hypothetical protein
MLRDGEVGVTSLGIPAFNGVLNWHRRFGSEAALGSRLVEDNLSVW